MGFRQIGWEGAVLLWWWVLGEFDTLFNVSLKSGNTGLEKLLLPLGNTVQDVDGLLSARDLFKRCLVRTFCDVGE
jgi:hypothetical protein